jgi:hypothetical protein
MIALHIASGQVSNIAVGLDSQHYPARTMTVDEYLVLSRPNHIWQDISEMTGTFVN